MTLIDGNNEALDFITSGFWPKFLPWQCIRAKDNQPVVSNLNRRNYKTIPPQHFAF